MPKQAKPKKQKPAARPVEFRAAVGGKNPQVNIYINGEFSEKIVELEQGQPRDIAATSLARELNRAFELGAALMAQVQEQQATTPAEEEATQ